MNYSRHLNHTPQSADFEIAEPVIGCSKPLCQQQAFEIDDSHVLELNDISDEEWVARQKGRQAGSEGQSGFTVQQWCDAVREAKTRSTRIITITNCCGGPLREEDIEHWVQVMATFHGILVLMISIDLAYDSAWDLAAPTTYHALALLCT